MSIKRTVHSLLFALVLASLGLLPPRTCRSEMVRMALHIDTKAGGGRYTVEEIARFVEGEGIDGAVIADHDNARITYGLFPLRHLLRRTLAFPSIEEYGALTYLADIEDASRRHPRLILIPGAEAVPFYYWEGNPLRGDLVLREWQRHMLVIGLDEPKEYENLPALHRGFGGKPRLEFFLPLAGVGMAAVGVYMTRKKIKRRFRFDRLTYTMVSRWPRLPGLLILAVSFLLFVEAYPFRSSRLDQYHGDPGATPYQALIDHADSLGALTFWAHPEASVKGEYGGVAYETSPYAHLLLETRGYDGFAIFWSGDREAGGIGGAWDTALLEYTRGGRERPVWAVGELDWEGENGRAQLGETLTLCFPEERSVEGVLSAMRAGRMISVRNDLGRSLSAIDFFMDVEAGDTARMGEELLAVTPPRIVFRMSGEGDRVLPQEVCLIRNGSLVVASGMSPGGEWIYQETGVPGPGELWYYRIVVGKGFPVIATNPVFVRGAWEPEKTSSPGVRGGAA